MSEPKPISAGELATTGVGELLSSLYEQKFTGSIVLAETEQSLHCVKLLAGLPQKVRLAAFVDPIGELLVEQGSIDQDQLREALEVAGAGGTLLGQTAMHMEMVSSSDLRKALAEQTLRRTARLFALQTGTFGVYREDFLASYGGADAPPVDPLRIIAAGVRAYYNLGRLERLQQPIAGAWLSLVPGTNVAGRFQFTKEEAAVVSALAEPRTLQDLAQAAGAPAITVRAVVYCLGAASALQASAEAPGRASAPPAAAGAAAEAGQPMGRRAVAEDLVARHKEMNFFELLGVQPGATEDEIQKAYVERARFYHPDRARGDLADLKAGLAEFFAQVTVARQTLMDPSAREKYMAKHGLVPAPRPTASPGPAAAAPPPAAGAPAGPKSAKRLELEELLAGYREMNYFEVLGIEPGATDANVQRAYVDRVRRFHPDRITGELADLREATADLFSHITQAHKVLKDPRSRRDYAASLEAGGGAKEEVVVQQILDAETSYQKARILIKTGQIDEAEALARSAVEAEPETGQYAALLAWIESKRRGLNENVDDLIVRLKEAAKAAPKSEEAHFYLAEMLNRAGRLVEAYREYDATVSLNEHNIDAVRMVRHLRRTLEERKKKKDKPAGRIMSFLMKDVKK